MEKTIKGLKVKETEKAVLLNVPCTNSTGHKCFNADKWFPKSALTKIEEDTYIVAAWISNKIDIFEKISVAYSIID